MLAAPPVVVVPGRPSPPPPDGDGDGEDDVPYPHLCETQPSLRWAVRGWRRRWAGRGPAYTERTLRLQDALVALFGPHRGDLGSELVRRFLLAQRLTLFHAVVHVLHAGWDDCPGARRAAPRAPARSWAPPSPSSGSANPGD